LRNFRRNAGAKFPLFRELALPLFRSADWNVEYQEYSLNLRVVSLIYISRMTEHGRKIVVAAVSVNSGDDLTWSNCTPPYISEVGSILIDITW
jgi:hypothetical protein